MFNLGVLTVSTSGYHGRREDTSGQAIVTSWLLRCMEWGVMRWSPTKGKS